MNDSVAVDTNILIYANDESSDYFETSKLLLEKVLKREVEGVLALQNLVEFCAVVTNRKTIPYVLSTEEAIKKINQIVRLGFVVILPNKDTGDIFLKILKKKGASGQKVHDIFLAATLISNGVSTLITENASDFAEIKGLKAVRLQEWGSS